MKDNEQQLEDIEASHALDGASYILFRYINLAEGGKILAEVELRNLWNLFVCVYGFEHTSVSFVFRSLNMNTNLKTRLSYSVLYEVCRTTAKTASEPSAITQLMPFLQLWRPHQR
jgi:hypothetical protein